MEDARSGVAIEDSEYDRIIAICRKSRRGVTLQNSNGQRWWFRMQDGALHADIRNPDDSVSKSEVFKKSDVLRQHSQSFCDTMKSRLQADHPDMSAEEIALNADILTEANESIKKLIMTGVDPKLAHALVKEVLRLPGGA